MKTALSGHTEGNPPTKRRPHGKDVEKMMDRVSLVLVIIGALNWLLVGLFQFDAVAWLFGGQTATLSRIVYAIVGLAGLWSVSLLFREREIVTEE